MSSNINNEKIAEVFIRVVAPYITAAKEAVRSLASFAFSIIYSAFALMFNLMQSAFNILVRPWLVKLLAQITNFNAALLQPLFARAPWLARVLQPFARLAPLFKGLQVLLAIAAIPYVVAATAGLAMFIYSGAFNLIINGSKSIKGFLFGDVDNDDEDVSGIFGIWSAIGKDFYNENIAIYQNYRRNNLLIRTRDFVKNLAGIVFWPPTVFVFIAGFHLIDIVANTWSAASRDAVDAGSETLDLPLFKIMRRPIRAALGDSVELEDDRSQTHYLVNEQQNQGNVIYTLANQLGYSRDPRTDRISLARLVHDEREISEIRQGFSRMQYGLDNAYIMHRGQRSAGAELRFPEPASQAKPAPVYSDDGDDIDEPAQGGSRYGLGGGRR